LDAASAAASENLWQMSGVIPSILTSMKAMTRFPF
jgi:hypothetical protein